MKNSIKLICIVLLFGTQAMQSQERVVDELPEPEMVVDSAYYEGDSLAYDEEINEEDEENAYYYQEPYQRKIQPNIKSRYTEEVFDYTRKVKKKEEPKPSNINLSWLGFVLKIIMYVIIGIFVVLLLFIIYKLIANYIQNKENRNTTTNSHFQQTIEDEEVIENNNYIQLIANAEQFQDYRLAFRYQFNWILQKATEKKWISWHKKKTNSDYVLEWKDKPNVADFKHIAHIFDYVWYGEFTLNESQYSTLKEQANRMRSLI